MSKLVLIRHGESKANKNNVFTGWSDSPLTKKGIQQALEAGEIIKRSEIDFDIVYTSFLQRSILTSYIIQEKIGQAWVPLIKNWRLNERHYGALRGLNKSKVAEKIGKKQVHLWRRSYEKVPPLLKRPDKDWRYDKFGISEPLGESAKMSWLRIKPLWNDEICESLKNNKNVLIVAHGSSIRVIIKYLDKISDSNFISLEVPNGRPILYEFGKKFNILSKNILH